MGTTRRVLVLLSLLAVCSPFPVSSPSGGPFSPDFTQLLNKNATAPTNNSEETPSTEAFKFLQTFGYLEKSNGDIENFFSGDAVVNAIKEMQKFGALPQTGTLDNATIELMHKPRCGVEDVTRKKEPEASGRSLRPLSGHNQSTRRRSKRYVVGSEGWRKRTITYFISNWSPKLSEAIVASEMQKAFQVWAEYGNLKFIRVNSPDADIIVAFGRGPHGDGYAFDGPGMVLAHAFYPYEFSSFGGDIHFDDDEKWKLKLEGPFDDGVDFFSVAVHELGHSLGLAHSPEKDSVMFPYFKGFNNNPARLGYDDVLAMYHMYVSKNIPDGDGRNTSSPPSSHPPRTTPRPTTTTTTTRAPTRAPYRPPTRAPTRTTQRPHNNYPHYPNKRGYEGTSTTQKPNYVPTYEGDYDTVTSHRRKFGISTPAFADKGTTEVAESVSSSTTQGTVTEITAQADGICEGTFDEVALIRGEIVLVKDAHLWRLADRGITIPGYPVLFKRLFWQLPEDVKKIDAMYERSTDNSIVIFSGDKYWETDGNKLLNGSPRPLTSLGLPSSVKKVDSAMVWGKNGKTYIFSDKYYWKYDDQTNRMEAGYPLKISERWRGVPSNIDSAMTFKDGLTYFFKGKQFWRFDNRMVQTDPQYPKSSAKEWLGCV